MFRHQTNGLTVAHAAKATIDAALLIWARARIPTQRVDSAVRKLRKLYDKYCVLKKTRLMQKESCRFKEEQFKTDLDELFDISRKDAISIMTNDEDKLFLQMQQEDPSSSSMAGVDKSLTKKEARKKTRSAEANARKQKSVMEIQQTTAVVPSTSTHSDVHLSSTSVSSDSDEDFRAPTACSPLQPKAKRMRKKNIVTTEVAAALDRVKLPDRGAMFVVSAVAQAIGVELEDVALSRNTIQSARATTRQSVSAVQKAAFMCGNPLLLHWDGKLLPDITGSKELVDRVAILVTGGQTEQLLAVPKIGRGTGDEQCNACLRALQDWNLKPMVQGLVFDTTASNNGLKMCACTLIEKALERELVWIACRHHVFEVMLADCSLSPSEQPVGLK